MTPPRNAPEAKATETTASGKINMASSNLVSPTNSSVKWHELHCDPILDIVLLAKDGVHLRASSHALKRESMLSSMPTSHQTATDAIPLDFTGDAIASFLDVYMSPSYCYYDFDPLYPPLAQIREYYKLIHYLDCDRFVDNARACFDAACDDDPIAWLIAASKDHDLAGGKAALLLCYQVNAIVDSTNIFSMISELRPSWRLPLLTCLLDKDVPHHLGHLWISWPAPERVNEVMEEMRQAE